jgi:hypothetical protein
VTCSLAACLPDMCQASRKHVKLGCTPHNTLSVRHAFDEHSEKTYKGDWGYVRLGGGTHDVITYEAYANYLAQPCGGRLHGHASGPGRYLRPTALLHHITLTHKWTIDVLTCSRNRCLRHQSSQSMPYILRCFLLLRPTHPIECLSESLTSSSSTHCTVEA